MNFMIFLKWTKNCDLVIFFKIKDILDLLCGASLPQKSGAKIL